MRKKSIPYRHFESKREISIAARKSASLCHFINEVLVLRFSAISYLLLTGVQERFLDYARNDDAREALSKLRGASIFLCAAPPFRISHFAFLISNFSFKRGFHPQSRGSTPKGLTPNPEP